MSRFDYPDPKCWYCGDLGCSECSREFGEWDGVDLPDRPDDYESSGV